MADDLSTDEYRADPLRRGLLSHSYRLSGSVREAETLVRRTPASTPYADRKDLYQALTQDFLANSTDGRPLPSALVAASNRPEGELSQRPEILWLEPFPDDLADGRRIGLDYIAALQQLPPVQRAALILSDIEDWPAADIADVLRTGQVDTLLTEARSHLSPSPPHTGGADQAGLLQRYSQAFELYDVRAIVGLFTRDAIWEMPPFTSWFRGAKNIGRLISTHCPAKGPGDQLLVPLWANGQPGFAVYMRDPAENTHRAFQIQVLTLTAAGIIHAVAFFDLSLFDAFHLPDLFTQLPENAFDHRPRIHLERARHHQNGE